MFGSAFAEDSALRHSGADLAVLEPVTVVGAAEERETGKSTLSEAQIKALPQGNGSINELLTTLPSVQASDMANTSLQGGEITPPHLSISGGRFYENNYVVDGIGNNSLLDPAASDPESIQNVPGHPQEMFLHNRLVDEITVYRSNISAEYGGFTGGVVDVKTKKPAAEFGGAVALRTTRDSWTRFHLDHDQEEDFENSNSSERQPRFRKYDGDVLLNLPLTERVGLLASYRRLYSQIPLRHFDRTRNQSRDMETYFLKYVYDISDRTTATVTYIETPFSEKRFRSEDRGSEIRNSWYTIDRGGYRLAGDLNHFFDLGELTVKGALRKSENTRQAPQHFYNWNVAPSGWPGEWDKDWGTDKYSKEGGYGDVQSSQAGENIELIFTFEPVRTGPVSHEIKLGYGFERLTGTYEREDQTHIYSLARNDASVNCGDNLLDCVDGQQYLWFRSVYEPDSVDETIDRHHLFIEDRLQFQRLTLRPGLRVARDNFMQNTDRDLRLAATYDLLGDGDTLLIAGVNRYHGQSLLTYKLSEAKKPYYTERRSKIAGTDFLGPWALVSQNRAFTRYSELKTPYSDELTFGVDQALLGGRLKVNYIERRGKDEFASQTSDRDAQGRTFTTLNNNGRSEHEEVGIEWERSWKKHYLALNATWQRTETSNENYRVGLEEEELMEQVYYHGDLINRIDLPRDDYNRAYVGNLVYSATLPHGFTFTNRTRYRSGYCSLEDTGADALGPNGEAVPVYAKFKQPESWLFDWVLDWRRDLYRKQGIQLSLEVYNVFNQKVKAGALDETYEMGRQVWAGMEYYF
ncbi:TonB-dependent receptor plug domain-containing protein [Trichloromonas sp.]|uniref:TonB-dependent receptor plug domain-containing protein n=1 Tax=Trichloromonas sp. TaxID=3069249 RepID=UPI003D81C4CD